MKTIYLVGAFTIVCLWSFNTITKKITKPAATVLDNTTVQITQEEFNSLTNAYSTANPTKTWGGRISKSSMLEVINSLPSESNIAFYFATESGGKTMTMFVGGNQGGTKKIIQNNGGDFAFCPTKCAMQSSSSNVTQSISETTFTNQKNAYSSANPDATLGGNFSKSSMQAIINSLADYSNINFRYCLDTEKNKISLIIIGGSTGQAQGQTLIIRNGGSDDAFCPTHCN